MKVRYKVNGRELSSEEFAQAGEPNRLAAMLASGRVPRCKTDREFLLGTENGRQFQDKTRVGNFYAAEAKAANVDITGKVYVSQLAAFPGDPEAWVSGRGDVQRICEARGWEAEGAVNVKMDQDRVARPTGGGVDPELVQAEAAVVAQEEGIAVEEACEKVYEKRKPHWCK